MRFASLSCISLLAVQVALSQPLRLQFTPVKREVVERRLESVPEKADQRGPRLRALLEEAGCAVTEQPVKGTRFPNLICRVAGEAGREVVVGAHYDRTNAGPGVSDNWSGAALLASLRETIAPSPRRHTFVFVGFSAEEEGLDGSREYVKAIPREERKKIVAMVNLDTLGLSTTKVWGHGSDPRLVNALGYVANALKLPVAVVNVDQVGTSDSQSFMDAKIPALDIHTVTRDTLRLLHSPHDNLGAIRRDDYYDTYRLMAAYLAFLDVAPPPEEKR